MMKSSRTGSMRWTSAVLAASCLVPCYLGGCAAGGMKGVVQAGPASVLVVVDETDKRSEAAGVDGVKIRVESRQGNAPTKVLASTVTDGAGKFKLNIEDRDAHRQQVWIIAEKEGYTTLSAPTYLPAEGRVLVVVLGGKRK